MVVHACSFSTWKAEAGESWILGQHSNPNIVKSCETQSQKQTNKNINRVWKGDSVVQSVCIVLLQKTQVQSSIHPWGLITNSCSSRGSDVSGLCGQQHSNEHIPHTHTYLKNKSLKVNLVLVTLLLWRDTMTKVTLRRKVFPFLLYW